jgi:hypothetical protein
VQNEILKITVVTTPNVLIRIQEVPRSNLDPDNGYPGRVLSGFSHFLQVNAWIIACLKFGHDS